MIPATRISSTQPAQAAVAPDVLRALSTLRPWARTGQIATQWVVCALAIGTAQALQLWPVTLAAMLVIATRQHAMLVLMHDASHYLVARRRWLNDVVGNLLLAFPLTVAVARYRDHHLKHHRHLNLPGDPDLADSIIPVTRSRLFMLLLRDVTGLTTLTTLRSANSFSLLGLFSASYANHRLDRWLAAGFIAAVVAAVAGLEIGQALVVYWLVPVLLFLPAILRVRGLAEHGARLGNPANTNARSLRVGWVERFLFAPCHINRHWEHHVFAAVPCYQLPRLSVLLAQGDAHCAAARPTLGYFIGPQSLIHELYPEPVSEPVSEPVPVMTPGEGIDGSDRK